MHVAPWLNVGAYLHPVLKLGCTDVSSDLCASEFGDSAESGEVRISDFPNGSGEIFIKFPTVADFGVNMCDTER